MLFAFIDTNIFIRVVSQGRPGCEHTHFADLQTLVEGGILRLLVPEVLLLELEKGFRALPREFESHCDKVMNGVTKATDDLWNEIDALKVGLLTQIASYKKQKLADAEKWASEIRKLLASATVEAIALTPEILLNGHRRQIAGRLPDPKGAKSQDALLIESLAAFFPQSEKGKHRLLFCSENGRDFGLEVDPKTKDRAFILHPLLQAVLPDCRYFVDLKTMLEFAKGYESLSEPSDEQFKLAVDMRDLHDEESEEYGNFHDIVMELLNKKVASDFELKVAATVPEEVKVIRAELAEDISELLKRLRACPTWNGRSEDKLPQWLEFVPEEMVRYTSLPNMVRIRNNLGEFLRRHVSFAADD
jgi:PIN domain